MTPLSALHSIDPSAEDHFAESPTRTGLEKRRREKALKRSRRNTPAKGRAEVVDINSRREPPPKEVVNPSVSASPFEEETPLSVLAAEEPHEKGRLKAFLKASPAIVVGGGTSLAVSSVGTFMLLKFGVAASLLSQPPSYETLLTMAGLAVTGMLSGIASSLSVEFYKRMKVHKEEREKHWIRNTLSTSMKKNLGNAGLRALGPFGSAIRAVKNIHKYGPAVLHEIKNKKNWWTKGALFGILGATAAVMAGVAVEHYTGIKTEDIPVPPPADPSSLGEITEVLEQAPVRSVAAPPSVDDVIPLLTGNNDLPKAAEFLPPLASPGTQQITPPLLESSTPYEATDALSEATKAPVLPIIEKPDTFDGLMSDETFSLLPRNLQEKLAEGAKGTLSGPKYMRLMTDASYYLRNKTGVPFEELSAEAKRSAYFMDREAIRVGQISGNTNLSTWKLANRAIAFCRRTGAGCVIDEEKAITHSLFGDGSGKDETFRLLAQKNPSIASRIFNKMPLYRKALALG